MSTASVEDPTPSPRRSSANRARSEAHDTHSLERSLGLVVNEMSRDTVEGLRTVVPNALLRPTTAVDFGFDVIEQMVSVGRRTGHELASILEAAIEAAEQRAVA
jgi:hypothetical protein